MPDLSKIIKGMEYCIDYAQRIKDKINDVPCSGCPYVELKNKEVGYGDCIDTMIIDALALLKAQQPIEERLHLCESCIKEYPECDATKDGVEFGCGTGNDNIIGCTAYMNRWKAQEPAKPTDEQREATPWEAGTVNGEK